MGRHPERVQVIWIVPAFKPCLFCDTGRELMMSCRDSSCRQVHSEAGAFKGQGLVSIKAVEQ